MRDRKALRLATLLAAVLLVHLVLIAPNHPSAATLGALRLFPLELPVIFAALVLAPRRIRRGVRIAVTAALTLMALVKFADLAAHLAYLRPFNPVLDAHLLPASWRMLSGAAGTVTALAVAALLVAATAALGCALWWASGRIARVDPPAGMRAGMGAAVLLAGALPVAQVQGIRFPGEAFTARLAWEHLRGGIVARADLARFRAEAASDPLAGLAPAEALPALAGRDVLLIFVESYGRAALDNPRYAPTVRATLAGMEDRLAARGLAMASGFLASPVVGGQSWLAHATLLSGLEIDSQGRYRALVASPRRTLMHIARAGGWRTAAVMPAITLAWPEGGYFGYDAILTADDLDYAGRPFGWVSVPDQFTLVSLERTLLAPGPRPPVFAEVALISSHAPWSPIPPLLAWEAIGDGRVLDRYAAGTEIAWTDTGAIRDGYRDALAYSLGAVAGFAERRAASGALIVVLGDHQAVASVAEDGARRDVPIHVIGPPDMVDRIEEWGFTPGMLPAADAPVWPMRAFRDRFVAAFGEAAAGGSTALLR